MGTEKQRPRKFTDEFKAEAVKLWRQSGDTKLAVVQRLGIDSTFLGNWIKQADVDEGNRDGVTSDERDELVRLRKENNPSRRGDFPKCPKSHFIRIRDGNIQVLISPRNVVNSA